MNEREKVYISGRISGLPIKDVVYKFHKAETLLRERGYDVINPLYNGLPTSSSWEKHLAADLLLLHDCDCIYRLGDSDDSKGARLEMEYAQRMGKEILTGDCMSRACYRAAFDYIECGGLRWALQNAGTDAENPNGKLYTFEEALDLENDTWRLPTRDEQEIFIDRTYYGFDEGRKSMTFVDRETGVKLEFPAVGYRSTSGTLYFAGTDGFYWLSTQGSSTGAYDMYFSSGNVSTGYNDKRVGFSVRCVCR